MSFFDNYLRITDSKINTFTYSSQFEMDCVYVLTKQKEKKHFASLNPHKKNNRHTSLIHHMIKGLRTKINAFSFLVTALKKLGWRAGGFTKNLLN